jgi:hypothetical protein
MRERPARVRMPQRRHFGEELAMEPCERRRWDQCSAPRRKGPPEATQIHLTNKPRLGWGEGGKPETASPAPCP